MLFYLIYVHTKQFVNSFRQEIAISSSIQSIFIY